MIYRQLDANGDMVFGQGAGNFFKDVPEATGQAISTKLKLFQGEWFIYTTAGVPWESQVFGFGTIPFYDFVIQDTIASAPGFSSLVNYSSYIDQKRNVSISATVNTIYGITTVSSQL